MPGAMDLGIADDGECSGHEQAAQIVVTLLADTAEPPSRPDSFNAALAGMAKLLPCGVADDVRPIRCARPGMSRMGSIDIGLVLTVSGLIGLLTQVPAGEASIAAKPICRSSAPCRPASSILALPSSSRPEAALEERPSTAKLLVRLRISQDPRRTHGRRAKIGGISTSKLARSCHWAAISGIGDLSRLLAIESADQLISMQTMFLGCLSEF
jgi:hypothetical protein